MADKVGLTIVKRFTYRGDDHEEWSNTYHLTGDIPADSSAWHAVFSSVADAESLLYPPTTEIVRAYGYDSDADDATAVWTLDLVESESPIPGALTGWGTQPKAPGDSAAWVRWKTSRENTNGKPIYLRKYFHDVLENALGEPDKLWTDQRTAMLGFAETMRDGSLIDGRTITARLHDDTIIGGNASVYLTTRTLKRRGKRPGS